MARVGLLTRLCLASAYDPRTQPFLHGCSVLFYGNFMSKKLIQFVSRAFVVAAFGVALGQAEAKTKPNVLFIFADDQCYASILISRPAVIYFMWRPITVWPLTLGS